MLFTMFTCIFLSLGELKTRVINSQKLFKLTIQIINVYDKFMMKRDFEISHILLILKTTKNATETIE